jgi:multiple sugar transport system permease protein
MKQLMSSQHNTLKAQTRRHNIYNYIVYGFLLIFFGLPLLWITLLSIRTAEEVWTIASQPIPVNPTLENFSTVLRDGKIQGYLLNSVKLVGIGTFIAFIGAAPAAYAMSRLRFRGGRLLLVSVLALQMISPLVIMIPLYRMLADLRLLDSQIITGVIYGVLGMPFMTWVLKGFFDKIPVELDEAALIDGCTRFQAFYRIILPVARPGVSSAIVLAIIVGWGRFEVPYILLKRTADLPISVGILALQGQQQYSVSTQQLLAAATLVSMAPVVILFLLMQRFVIRGLTEGALKG